MTSEDYEQLLTRLEEIVPEMETLAVDDEADETRFAELNDEFDELNTKRVAYLEKQERLTQLREAVADPRNMVRGDAALRVAGTGVDGDPIGNSEARTPNKRLFDFDELERLRTAANGHNELRAMAMDAIETAPDVPGLYGDTQRSNVEAMLNDLHADDVASDRYMRKLSAHIVAVSSPEYQKHFRNVVMSFGRTGQADVESTRWIQRAMSLTDGEGGYAVPLPIDPTLVKNYDTDVNPMRSIATVRQITGDVLRTVNTTAVAASFDAEAAEVSDDATTLANIDITPAKAQAFVPFSIEIGQDFPNMTSVFGDLIADARDDLEATAFATGSGTNAPVGIVTALTGGSYEVASNTTDVFAMADVYDLDEELPSQYGRRASWLANKRIYQAIREAGDANLDDFWVNAGAGLPGNLLGHPIYEATAMDGVVNAAAENYVLIVGDFSNYYVVDRAVLSIELVPHLFATANNLPSGQRGLYAWWRVGGDSVNDRAFRMLNVT